MRNQTKDKKVQLKVDNLAEHLSSIRNDIESEGKRLLDLRQERVRIEQGDKERTKELERLEKELSNRISLCNAREAELNTISDVLDIKRQRLDEDSKSFEVFTLDAQIDLDRKISAAKALEDSIKYSIKTLEAERESVINSIQLTLSTKKEELEALNQQIRLLDKEKDNLSTELDKILESVRFNQFVLGELEEAIDEAKQANEEERGKNKLVIASFEDREAQIERREKNFLIVKARLAKVLDKLYPGQNIDNLI